MNLWLNSIIQTLGLAAQVVNIISPILSDKNKIYAAGGIAALQGAVGIISHHYNTDGTSQKVGFN